MSTELSNRLEHTAGLNPRGAHLFRGDHRFGGSPARNVLNVDSVFRFIDQKASNKSKWARNKGTSMEKVMGDLSKINHELDLF